MPYAITNEHGFIPQNEAHDEFGYMKDTDRRAYNIVEPRSFAYNPARINVGSLGYYEGSENVIVSSLYEVFKTAEYVDDRFLWHWLKSPELPKWIGKLQEGSVRLYFYYDKLCECILRMPSIDEQRKIAKYLDNLDHLITLHQRKRYHFVKRESFAWEQRKLSNCAGFRRGSFPQPYGNKDWYDGEGAMPFVQVADVSDDMKLVDDTKQKISKLAQPMSVCAEEGSVLVTLQGSIGRVAITQYKAFVDRTVLIFDKYNADIDKIFWAYIIKEKFIEEARKAPGGTIKTITKEVLSDFDLMLPSYDEQKMLGKLLHSLDDLITLHQREHIRAEYILKYIIYSKGEGENARIRENNRRKINRSIGLW